jgi:hypothetical protein
MSNITISNVYAEIPAGKPDAGYNYEGPVEDMPRNVSPSSIAGMPDSRITDITLRNIEIHHPGGGNPLFARIGTDELDKVPELAGNYPEFSMFKELPAWGFYVRHAKNIIFDNVTLYCDKKDYRSAIVLDDADGVEFKSLRVKEPESGKLHVFIWKSSNISGISELRKK